VAAAWGVTLWCAAAPVFDSRYDKGLLALWSPYLAKPLPSVAGPRWLTPPTLEALVGLYTERLRSHRPEAATVLLRTMWSVAGALRADSRFRIRADALVSVVGATLANPQADQAALQYGDGALLQQWLARVPPTLAQATRAEHSAGDNLRHAFYEFVNATATACGDPSDMSYVEPRLVAASLLAADLAVVKRDMADEVIPWLDPEISFTVGSVLDQPGHPLRRYWPGGNRLSEALRANLGGRGATLLASAYAMDLAWCRALGIPARPRGFPVPVAVFNELLTGPSAAEPSPRQAKHPYAAASQQLGDALGSGVFDLPDEPVPSPPAQPPAASEIPPIEELPSDAWVPPYTMLGIPHDKAPCTPQVGPDFMPKPFGQDESDDPYQPPSPGPSPEEIDWSPQYTQLGFPCPDAPAEQEPTPEAAGAESAPSPTRVFSPEDAPADLAKETLPDRPRGTPVPPPPAGQPENPGTQIMSQAMVGDILDLARSGPSRSRPLALPLPGGDAPDHPVTEMHGVTFVGATGAASDVSALIAEILADLTWARPPASTPPPATVAIPPTPATRLEPNPTPPNRPHPNPPQDNTTRLEPAPPPSEAPTFDAVTTRVEWDTNAPDGPAWPPDPGEEATPPAQDTPDGDGPVEEPRSEENTDPARPDAAADDAVMVTRVEWESAEAGDSDGGAGSRGMETRFERIPAGGRAGAPSVLLVGEPHTGQARVARMVASALAEAGAGPGRVRTVAAAELRGASASAVGTALSAGDGEVLFVEAFQAVVADAADPVRAAASIRAVRQEGAPRTVLIASCTQRGYRRLLAEYPEMVEGFRVFRTPSLRDAAGRVAVLNVLAAERSVVVDATAFGVVQHDLARLRGRGDLVNARLVEVYLEGAVRRALAREAASGGSGGIDGGSTRVLGGFEPNATLVDVPREGGETREPVLLGEDFAGVAEELEPAARRPVEFETALAGLEGLVGLRPVKEMVRRVLDSGTAPHLMLLGLAGTGKTTVATLMADVYAARGLVEPGRVVRCRPVHLAGRDRFDTEERVHGLVEQAVGGVLLVDEAHRLVTCPDVVTELRLAMAEHRDDLVVICAGDAEGFEAWLLDNPEFRGLFGEVVRFTEPTDRELLQMFQLHAERDLYTLDEELRLELLTRFGRMRESPDFAFGRTARELFEQTTARQAARLRGANVSAALVTRLSARDLPESRFGRGF
jgi:hypothetical protein